MLKIVHIFDNRELVMKQFGAALCFFFLAFTIQAKGIQDDINFAGEEARTSYAFGMTVGGDLRDA